MTIWRIIRRGLHHHRRIHAAVALSVAAATAVLTGALLVGDSVRGSLRALTLERLGRIDEVLVTPQFFHQELAEAVRQSAAFRANYADVASVILFPAVTVETQDASPRGRAAQVWLIGCDESFWSLSEPVDGRLVRPARLPGQDEVILNDALADDLGVRVGERVVLRLPKGTPLPADSPLAHRDDRIESLTGLTVVEILPARGLGRFSLTASQRVPPVAFVSRTELQRGLGQEGRVNALLASGGDRSQPPSAAASEALSASLRPTLDDFGLKVQRIERSYQPASGEPRVAYQYWSVSTDRMILPPATVRVAQAAFAPLQAQPVLTYLANSIRNTTHANHDRSAISYSTITAIDPGPAFPLVDIHGQPIGPLGEDEIVLNRWAAEDQRAEVGDVIEIDYFEPETVYGQTREATARFTLKAIAEFVEPVAAYRRRQPAEFRQPPTWANDPDLTPTVQGITDQDSMANWDAPFPFDYTRVRDRDDDYWERHRTTPKAVVSLAAGGKLWGSRFGAVTSLRIPIAATLSDKGADPLKTAQSSNSSGAAGEGQPPFRTGSPASDDTELTAERIERLFVEEAVRSGERLGFEFQRVKQRQLDAAAGTTPFDGLFLGLSFFIIAAALMLVALLFRLGVDQRAAEIGLLIALGWRRRKVARVLLAEAAVVATAGSLLGVLGGVGYSRAMLAGLRTWWVGAITTPFLTYHARPISLLLGAALGVIVSLATITWMLRPARGQSVRGLLSGRSWEAGDGSRAATRTTWQWIAIGLVTLALVCAGGGATLAGMARAGAFFGAGMLMLAGLWILLWRQLAWLGHFRATSFTRGAALWRLAVRNAARNPTRSATTIGLMACASFLILALSAFRLSPTSAAAGGFQLLAVASEPVFDNLNDPARQHELFADQAALLAGTRTFAFRLRAGDDASCNNLYRSAQPQALGVSAEFVRCFDDPQQPCFRWLMTAANTADAKANPWQLLEAEPAADAPIPVVLDLNTASYSLKPPVSLGSVFTVDYDETGPRQFRVVGLLENSLLQGSLLIGEGTFKKLFPNISGYRWFLVRVGQSSPADVARLLEDRLSDQGFDASHTDEVLSQLFAVQNTYLSTFQTLGGLGLLLGTLGLVAVQMRSVLERRGELALLQAAGFPRRRVGRLVLRENLFLLLAGLGMGSFAALVTVLPLKLMGDSGIPTRLFADLVGLMAVLIAIGLFTGWLTARAVLRARIVAALRGD